MHFNMDGLTITAYGSFRQSSTNSMKSWVSGTDFREPLLILLESSVALNFRSSCSNWNKHSSSNSVWYSGALAMQPPTSRIMPSKCLLQLCNLTPTEAHSSKHIYLCCTIQVFICPAVIRFVIMFLKNPQLVQPAAFSHAALFCFRRSLQHEQTGFWNRRKKLNIYRRSDFYGSCGSAPITRFRNPTLSMKISSQNIIPVFPSFSLNRWEIFYNSNTRNAHTKAIHCYK